MSIHRNNLVKDKKNSMVQNCVFITLGFLPEFRVCFLFFGFIILQIMTGEKKLVGNISDCSQENCSEEKIIIKSVEVRNKNTREVPWFRFGVRRSEAKPIFSLGSIFRLGIYFAWFNTSLSSIVRLVPFFARFNFSLGFYFRGFNFRGFSNPRK